MKVICNRPLGPLMRPDIDRNSLLQVWSLISTEDVTLIWLLHFSFVWIWGRRHIWCSSYDFFILFFMRCISAATLPWSRSWLNIRCAFSPKSRQNEWRRIFPQFLKLLMRAEWWTDFICLCPMCHRILFPLMQHPLHETQHKYAKKKKKK